MTPVRQDFLESDGYAWLRGDTVPAWQFELLNDNGTPVVLTGASIILDIYDRINGSLLARLRTTNAPAAPGGQPEGVITITSATLGTGQIEQVPPTVTNALIPSKSARKVQRWYTFEITWAGSPNVVMTPFSGFIEVLPDGT